MRYMTVQLLFLLTLGSCASPPKPPTVDESRKRPANAAIEVVDWVATSGAVTFTPKVGRMMKVRFDCSFSVARSKCRPRRSACSYDC